MAEEVASIGVKFETDDIARGKASLEALAQQGPKVEKAMAGVEGAATKTGKSLKTLAEGSTKGLDDIGKSAPQAADGIGRVAKSADDAKRALAAMRDSASGLSGVSSAAVQAAQGLRTSATSIQEMQAAVRAATASVQSMAVELARVIPSAQAVAKAQADAAKTAQDMGLSFKAAGDQARAYASASANIADTSVKAAKSMDATSTAARALSAALAVAGVGFGAQELITMIDGYTKFTAQLKLATKGASDYGLAMASTKRIATDAQQGLGEVGALYARIANGTAELGLSQSRLSDITETVALSLKVSGAAASESSSAMLQLSQAFASGVLRGEEFNSVNEAAPRLMKALADGIGVPVGALRKMAAEGQLTSSVLADSLPKALGKLREEAKEVQTIGGAFTVLKNNIMEMVGAQSNASGATKALAGSVSALANNLDVLAMAGGAVALVMASKVAVSAATATAAFVAEQAAVVRLGAAIAGTSATSVVGLTAMAAASRAAAASLAFLAGPWGAALLLAGGAATAFYSFRDSASDLAKSLGDLGQPLDELQAKLDKLPPEKRIAVVIEYGKQQDRSIDDVRASFEALGTAVLGTMTNLGAPEAEIQKLFDRLNDAKQSGENLVPILQDVASSAGVKPEVLNHWVVLAANLRTAQGEANDLKRALDAINGSTATSIPLVSAENAVILGRAKAILETTKGLKSQGEQMAEVRKQASDLTDRLNALRSANLGSSKEAKDLEERLKGAEERLKSMAKRGQQGVSAAKAEQSAYASLSATIEGKIALNKEEVNFTGRLNEAQKAEIKLNADLKEGKVKLSAAHEADLRKRIEIWKEQEKAKDQAKRNVATYQEQLEIQAQLTAEEVRRTAAIAATTQMMTGYRQSLEDTVAITQLEYSTLGMTSVARNTLIEQLRIEFEWRDRIEKVKNGAYASSAERDAAIAEAEAMRDRQKANAQTKAYISEWEKSFDQASQSLTDALMRGGKNAGEYLKDYFRTLVLRPVIKAIVQPVAGGIADGVTSVLGLGGSGGSGAGGASSALSTASNANSLLSMTGAVGAGVKAGLQGWAGTLGLSGTGTTLGGSLSAGFTALGSGNIAGGLGTLLGVAGPVLGAVALLSQMDFGSRGANHTGGAYSTSSSDRNTAASQALGSDAWGNALGDITDRANKDLDKQLGKTVDALSGVYASLAKYATNGARQIDIAAAFAVNPSHSDEDNYGYFQLIDKITGDTLSTYKARDGVLGTDPEKAYEKFVGEMGGALVEQLKAADIPGWMRSIFDGLGDDVTVDGLNQAIQAIAVVDSAFKGWADTLQGFSGLSAEVQTSLLKVSGGIEVLGTNVSAFYSGFYTEAERMGILQRQVLEQLGSLDVTLDTSTAEAAKASFKATVEGALNAGNGELAAKLLALSASFATAADYAGESAEKIVTAAKESATAAAELATSLRSSLVGLEAQFAGGGFARQYQAEGLAGQVQGLFAGVGISKDAGVLAGQILGATSGDIEQYFRDMWGMLNTDEARQKLVDVTGALLDLAGAADAAAAAVASEREGLEQRWLQATGNTAELRRRELEALDPSNRALLQMIYGLEDAKTSMTDLTSAATTAAQQAAAAWQNWGTAAGLGATYLGDTSGLEARRAILGSQIAGSTDPADRLSKLQELISVEQAIGQAQQASRKTELEAINARQSALQKEVASAQQLLTAAQGLGSYVQSLRLGEASGLSDADRLGALGNEYASLVGKARGGDADALQRLQSVAGDYLGLSRALSASGSDYSVLAGRVSAELEAVSKAQELVAQSQVTGYEAQIAQLAQQSEYLSAQVELSDGTKSLIAKSMVDQADVWDRENTQALTLQELQQRAADSLALMPTGIASAIKPTIESSATYIANSVYSVTSAVNSLAGLLAMDGSHATGLAYVPFDGYRAELHRGERVLTAEESRAYSAPQPFVMRASSQSNAELIAEIRALKAQVAALQRPTEQIATATMQQAEQFDNATAGGNGMAVSIMEQAAPLQVKEVA